MSYNSILKRGARIALRSKVNESIISGLRIVDSLLPVGRGQRQLILGDRNTGKSSIFLCTLLHSLSISYLGSLDGFGSKRLFSLYIGICLNLSKLSKFISYLLFHYFTLILASHSSSSSLLSFLLPSIGISIAERLSNRGLHTLICFDDLSKHAKSYRQINLILGVIPSRDAYPAAVFNVHSSLLERACSLSRTLGSLSGSVSSFPVIETVNSDITDFIATNVISITDGQFYLSRSLFLSSIRPSLDSGLSVSRIGSSAQCKFIKYVSSGLKNTLTLLRSSDIALLHSSDLLRLRSLNSLFYADPLSISLLAFSSLLLLSFHQSHFSLISSLSSIHLAILLLSTLFVYALYVISISLHSFSSHLASLLSRYLVTISYFAQF
jgi:F-type H+-transporting ATPase subunit alpha